MPSFELILIALTGVLVVVAAAALFWALRRSRSLPEMVALEQGDFERALALADRDSERGLWIAAVAEKHLLALDAARGDLEALLGLAPDHGEALIELGLVDAYAGDHERAFAAWERARQERSDLAETVDLHRAWLALRRGDRSTARALFEEIEAPLETKLREDLGHSEPLLAEWYLQAAELWLAIGRAEIASWSAAEGRRAAAGSRLLEHYPPLRDDSGARVQS